MIALLGDVHGEFHIFDRLWDVLPPNAAVVQLGDFGIWPGWEDKWRPTPWPVYFLDGNHEYFPMIQAWGATDRPVRVASNLYYVPRGCVLELQGRRFGCLGGGDSVDVRYRQRGRDWFPDERVTVADVQRLKSQSFDMLLTHSPPSSMLPFFPPLDHEWFGLPSNWRSESSILVETAWQLAGCPPLVCGHMHASRMIGNCRALDINEVYELWEVS